MLQRIQSIGTCEDDAERRTLLANFQTDLETDYDSLDKAQTDNTTYQAEIKKLQENNMKLFLQIGNHEKPNVDQDKSKEKRKFEDLFNEKGVLK